MTRLLGAIFTLALTTSWVSAHCVGDVDASHDHPGAAPAGIDSPALVGEGDICFVTVPGWGARPDAPFPGSTHGSIVVDSQNLVYVCTDTENSILVYDADGKFIKAIGEPRLKIHGLTIVKEKDEEFIYAASSGRQIVKLKMDGTKVWAIDLKAQPPEYTFKNVTAVAVAPDGSVYAADGYGTQRIVKFDSNQKPVKVIGVHGGGEDGQFKTCHGLIFDTRNPDEPQLLVADRENRRVVAYDLDLNFKKVLITDLRRPCSFSIYKDTLAVAELEARVVILDKDNKLIARLGDNENRGHWANFGVPVDQWKGGIFTAPHGCGFDADGNLYVQDWNRTGRTTKLLRLHK
jgi:hypothetical protein